VIKIGVTTVPPIWFACLRYVIGTACLVATELSSKWPSKIVWAKRRRRAAKAEDRQTQVE